MIPRNILAIIKIKFDTIIALTDFSQMHCSKFKALMLHLPIKI